MSMSIRIKSRIAAAVAIGCTGLGLASTAGAVDLRSWDQKINDVSKRFIMLPAFANQAVLDKETQLVWEREPDPTFGTWLYADYNRCAITPIGGRSGWRLPSRFEFMSLMDPSVAGTVKLPAGHPFVGIQPNAKFWTSSESPNPGLVDVMVVAEIGVLSQYAAGKTSLSNVRAWCVRGQGSPTGY
jgi:hypothetical protein